MSPAVNAREVAKPSRTTTGLPLLRTIRGVKTPTLAPGVPTDYYARIAEIDTRHWWYRGMLEIECALLGERLHRPGQRLLDAGCGTGGMLRWAFDSGYFASITGVDLASDAIELARQRAPEADLQIAPLHELPFADESFDMIVSNDVLQHIHERQVDASLRELRRALAASGTLLVRTNGSRHLRRERDDWRVYDRRGLEEVLRRAGFVCESITYANMVLSLAAAARGRSPHAPTEKRDGVPPADGGRLKPAVGARILSWEAWWLSHPGRSLPYGHNLLAVAVPS